MLLVLSACASTQPDQVPEFKTDALPAVQLKGFKPRTLKISVNNIRTANQKANNSALVEKAVFTAVQDSFVRGGFTLNAKSSNHLLIELMDCVDAAEGAACVKVKGRMETKSWTITMESFSSNGYTKGNRSYQSFGDMSAAYESSLAMVLHGLDEKYGEMGK